ncbi:MAG: SMP-30/gluconolactonase/LRE family protein [Isosphaeraceae bacterium]
MPKIAASAIFSIALLLSNSADIFAQAPATIDSPIGNGNQGFSGDGGPAAQAMLDQPFDVTIDTLGRILFSDTFNHRIRRYDPKTRVVETIAGSGKKGYSGDGGPALKADLNEPYGVKLSAGDSLLYIVDRLNFRVRRVDLSTGLIETFAGNGKPEYSGDGGPAASAGLVEPNGVALGPGPGGPTSKVYIADVRGHRIRVVDTKSGNISTYAGTGKGRHEGDGGPVGKASIFGARAVAVGPEGNVYILEREGNSLRAVDARTGVIRTIAGTTAKGDGGDGGPATAAQFNGPKELCVSPDGDSVYVVDTENQKIRRVDLKSGLIATVAGNGKRAGGGDGGPATAASLDRPHGVAVSAEGTVWIGDTNNHRIRRVFTK